MSVGLYLRLGLAIAAFAAVIGAFFYGQNVGKAKCERDHAAAQAKANIARDKQISAAQEQDALLAEQDVVRETIVREITREVPRIVDRPVYRNVCVDADGVQLLRRAVDAANGGATGGGPAGDPAELRAAPGDGQPGDR
jgi:hypothetical protein